jgi:arylsulfatase
VKDAKLHYVYNWLGEVEQEIVSDIDIPSGECVLGMAFEKEGNDDQHSALGTASLYINDQQVGELSIKTQPGKFMLSGEGVNIGKDPGGPVSKTAYVAPFPFSGGNIREVIIDVSGEQYIDLELEAMAMMSRD